MIKFDIYSRKARVYPCVIVLLPIFLLSLVHITNVQAYYHYFTSATLFGVLSFLLAHIGRDMGKKKEKRLFKHWGGKPTCLVLRHSDDYLNPHLKRDYHSKLQQIFSNIVFPTADEEILDLDAADAIYDRCCLHVISKTRDTDKYHLLFSENINYGFRRNLWGMKYVALLIAFLCVIFHLLIISSFFTFWDNINIVDYILLAVLLVSIFYWVFSVNKDWVKIPAFAYAERLYETLNGND